MAGGPRHFAENPFLILGVDPAQPRVEIEREGQKLLGMLALGLRAATTYTTPSGLEPRTPELVRAALAELRTPEKRLLHELWARGIAGEEPAPGPSVDDPLLGSDPAAGGDDAAPGDPYRGEPRSDADPPAAPEHPGFPGAFALSGWRRP